MTVTPIAMGKTELLMSRNGSRKDSLPVRKCLSMPDITSDAPNT